MTYGVLGKTTEDKDLYKRTDSDGKVRVTCIAEDPEFQTWLRANKNSLPSDIKAKVDDGTLIIKDAD
tara:strand:+ start:215 stop:415 length:201 start_codon:yes stop_codon:yes gene_type:complete